MATRFERTTISKRPLPVPTARLDTSSWRLLLWCRRIGLQQIIEESAVMDHCLTQVLGLNSTGCVALGDVVCRPVLVEHMRVID
jgi:hypothetical protein